MPLDSAQGSLPATQASSEEEMSPPLFEGSTSDLEEAPATEVLSVGAAPAPVSSVADWFRTMAASPAKVPLLAEKHAAGRAALAAHGVPSKTQEPWRHAPISLFFGDASLRHAGAASTSGSEELAGEVAGYLTDQASGAQLVFVDGRFSPELSDLSACGDMGQKGEGYVGSLSTLAEAAADGDENAGASLRRALKELDYLPEISYKADYRTRTGSAPLAALNQACFGDCAVIDVSASSELPGMVQVLFVSTGQGSIQHPRLVMCAGEGSELNLTQSYCSVGQDSRAFTNALTRLKLGEGATVRHNYLQETCGSHLFYESVSANVAEGGTHEVITFSTGADQTRINYDSFLDGE